jgi:hypothetical protein
MKWIIIFGVIAALGITGFFISVSQKPAPETPFKSTSLVHVSPQYADKKASFAIFTNGTFRIFTAAMYHNLSEDVYIEGTNPNIVYVKKDGITWDDFFKTLPFSLSPDCLTTGTGQTFCTNSTKKLKFYINRILDPNALGKKINNGDQLLISYGSENESEIKQELEQIPAAK